MSFSFFFGVPHFLLFLPTDSACYGGVVDA